MLRTELTRPHAKAFVVKPVFGLWIGVLGLVVGWSLLTNQLLKPGPFLPGFGVGVVDVPLRVIAVCVAALVGPVTIAIHSYHLEFDGKLLVVRAHWLAPKRTYSLAQLTRVEAFSSSIHGDSGLRLVFKDGRSQRFGVRDRNYGMLHKLLDTQGLLPAASSSAR